ncbi:hypothetical protein QR680_006247 [Steinernema hermaphroditum]|uniref:Uncharacterized protein n=1 Tax=Steinernema hermaphroditum TaxID=289476 RepID=A0AA39HVZ8_9BILA|nr:hypothetical protein QR680_006247 [Steinernema hermaphroditum]
MDSKVIVLVLLLIDTCLRTTYVQPQFSRNKPNLVPHNCLARGPYGGQYKCCVIIDYYSERFECYSLNVPYNFFERIGNGDFFRDPMPGQPSHPIILQSQQQMMDSESASSRLLFWNPDSLIFDLFNIIYTSTSP